MSSSLLPLAPKGRNFIGSIWIGLTVVLLLGLAILFRSYHLEELPTYIHNDESAQAIYVVPPFFEKDPPSPMWGFNNFGRHPNFGAWLTTLSVKWLGGKTLLAIRSGAAILGILSIVFFALFVRTWLGVQGALFFLVAVAPFHLHVFYSRTGFPYIHAGTFSALVALLFARVVQAPSWKRGVALGIGLGFALMVYAATLVLPAAVLAGLGTMILQKSSTMVSFYRRLKLGGIVILSMLGGLLLSMGQHLYHIYLGGFSSRFDTQSVLHQIPIEQRDLIFSKLLIIYESLKRTLFFFYQSDSAGQYGYFGAPLEVYSYSLSAIGLLALIYKCFRLDPNAVFAMVLGVSTIVGSAMMIEANFSPHLIIFALLIPLLCALGLLTLCRAIRIRSSAISALVALLIALPWCSWNYKFMMSREPRTINLDTYVLRLPIQRGDVRTLANLTPFYGNISESFYQMRYPNARVAQISGQVASGEITQKIIDLRAQYTCPCLVITPRPSAGEIADMLAARGAGYQRFEVPNIEADVLIISDSTQNKLE